MPPSIWNIRERLIEKDQFLTKTPFQNHKKTLRYTYSTSKRLKKHGNSKKNDTHQLFITTQHI